MAYVEKHNAQWTSGNGIPEEIKFLQRDGVAGSVSLEYIKPVTYSINGRGSKEDQMKTQIWGSDLEFSFVVSSANIATIDAIFESDFKEWKIVKYYNSAIQWVGFINGEAHYRNYIKNGDYYEIVLMATDGLAELQKFEFLNFSTGEQYTDRVSVISTIKRALEWLELELDFKVQFNTYVTNDSLMTSSECFLDKGDVANHRFTKDDNGRIYNESCHAVISKALKPLSCKLRQFNGEYWIVNMQEKNSYVYPITWSGLTVGTRTANDLRINTQSYNWFTLGQNQSVRPLRGIGTTFRDRNVQDNLLSNGDFSTASTSEWSNNGEFQNFDTIAYGSGYELRANINVDLLGVPSETPRFYLATQEPLVTRSATDQVRVDFKLRCTDIDMGAAWSGPDYYERISVKCQLRKDTINGDIIVSTSGGAITIGEEDSSYTLYTRYFPLEVSHDYFIEFIIDEVSGNAQWDDYDNIEVRFDNIYFTVEYGDGSENTYDRYLSLSNEDNTFIDLFFDELHFGDSVQDNDIGGYQISGTRTRTWNRFGKTENLSIQRIHQFNTLENFSKYKKHIMVEIEDENNSIFPYSIIQIDGKDYEIINFSIQGYVKLNTRVRAELVEVLNDPITLYTVISQLLTSIDGSPATGSSTSSTGAGVYAPIGHDHDGTYEPIINPKNTAFNKNFGGVAGTVAAGNHTHSGYLSKTAPDVTSYSLGVGSLKIGVSKWTLQLNGNDLEFSYNGTVVGKLTSAGYWSTADDQEANDSGL